MELRKVQDAQVEGRTVVVRVDYNVPMKDGRILDDGRIALSLPTLTSLVERGAKIVLLTHLGRPEGLPTPALQLDPIAVRLEELMGHPIRKLPDCVGADVVEAVESGEAGDIFLLENVRFHSEETGNETAFARELAKLGEVFVNDAFATVHRSHASTVGVTEFLPSYAGLLMQAELAALSHLMESPERPYVAIIGGKKAESKLGALRGLLTHVDGFIIGGGVAFSFLRAIQSDVGVVGMDAKLVEEINAFVDAAESGGVPIILPQDTVCAETLGANVETQLCDVSSIPAGWTGFDIGPETIRRFEKVIRAAKTILWTGPLGVFEYPSFAEGTQKVAEAVAAADAYSVIGGGETGEAVKRFGCEQGVSYISTGGGACLAYLRGKPLPALEALRA